MIHVCWVGAHRVWGGAFELGDNLGLVFLIVNALRLPVREC